MIRLIAMIIFHLSDDEEVGTDYGNDEGMILMSIKTATKALGTRTEMRGQFREAFKNPSHGKTLLREGDWVPPFSVNFFR